MARTKQVERVRVIDIDMDDDGSDTYVPASLFTTEIDIDSREALEIFLESLKHLSREELETDLFNTLPAYGPDSRVSFSERCHADVCFSLRQENENSHDVPMLTLQLILTFAFLHLSPVDRKRLVERHPVIDNASISSDSSDVSISSNSNGNIPDNAGDSSFMEDSSYEYNDSEAPTDDDRSWTSANPRPIGCLEIYIPEEGELDIELDFIPVPQVEDLEPVYTSSTQVCLPGQDPADTLPPLFREVPYGAPTAHIGRRIYRTALVLPVLTGTVEPERVGTIRRGDEWNGRPDPLTVGEFDPDYPDDFRSEDPNDYNLRPYASAQPGSVSIPAALGYNRQWDSRFPPPPYSIKHTLSPKLLQQIVCAEIPFLWSDPNASALIGEWKEDHLRRLEWCKLAQLVEEKKLSFWKGYFKRRELDLPVVRGCGNHW